MRRLARKRWMKKKRRKERAKLMAAVMMTAVAIFPASEFEVAVEGIDVWLCWVGGFDWRRCRGMGEERKGGKREQRRRRVRGSHEWRFESMRGEGVGIGLERQQGESWGEEEEGERWGGRRRKE